MAQKKGRRREKRQSWEGTWATSPHAPLPRTKERRTEKKTGKERKKKREKAKPGRDVGHLTTRTPPRDQRRRDREKEIGTRERKEEEDRKGMFSI